MSALEIASFAAAIASLVLAIVAIVLSIVFYTMSSQLSESAKDYFLPARAAAGFFLPKEQYMHLLRKD